MPLRSVLLSFLLVGACTSSQARPPATATSSGETSSATSCARDEDCYCRVFDGARFHEGRDASKCCTQEAGCADGMGAQIAAGHCMTCVYD